MEELLTPRESDNEREIKKKEEEERWRREAELKKKLKQEKRAKQQALLTDAMLSPRNSEPTVDILAEIELNL